MKVVILCGGKGSRIRSVTDDTPKPLVIVNGKPIIWHIMKIYSSFGFNEFVLPLGFGGDKIREYFWNYRWKNCDFITDMGENKIKFLEEPEDWNITLIDTGIETMTGGRIKKIEKYIDGDTFMLTYGDGLADLNINELLRFHNEKGRIATVTGIKRNSQYGILTVEDGIATSFKEKSKLNDIINGGFFILNKKVFQYLDDNNSCIFEKEPMSYLAKKGELAVYIYNGFWIAIDTYKDLVTANETWKQYW